MYYQLRAVRDFTDGNAWPRTIKKGEVVEVNEVKKNQLMRSDPEGFTVVGKIIPKATGPTTDAKRLKDAES